jgi:hypothetical protein
VREAGTLKDRNDAFGKNENKADTMDDKMTCLIERKFWQIRWKIE